MQGRQFLNYDPLYGMTEYFIPSDDGKDFTIEYVQDETRVKALLDRNKADLNEVSKTDRWGDGKLVARIPPEIYTDWATKGYLKDQKKLKQLLNDPDNRWMRIWPGVL